MSCFSTKAYWWYGKTQVASHELRGTIYKLRVESLKAWVESLKERVKT